MKIREIAILPIPVSFRSLAPTDAMVIRFQTASVRGLFDDVNCMLLRSVMSTLIAQRPKNSPISRIWCSLKGWYLRI